MIQGFGPVRFAAMDVLQKENIRPLTPEVHNISLDLSTGDTFKAREALRRQQLQAQDELVKTRPDGFIVSVSSRYDGVGRDTTNAPPNWHKELRVAFQTLLVDGEAGKAIQKLYEARLAAEKAVRKAVEADVPKLVDRLVLQRMQPVDKGIGQSVRALMADLTEQQPRRVLTVNDYEHVSVRPTLVSKGELLNFWPTGSYKA